MAHLDHQKGDVKIKAIAYNSNWHARGIREAIEIKKRKPTLNADEGRYHLNPIYDIVFGDTKKEKEEEEVTEELNISNNSEEGGRSPPEINNKSQENSSP